MFNIMMRKIFLVVLFVLLLKFPKDSIASTFSLSPASGNISQGGTLSVRLNLNTGGDSVNGFSAFLSYPADKVEVSSISYGSRFAIAAEGAFGGGSIRISRGSIEPVSGSVTVATINFRGKSPGAAAVSMTGGAVPKAADSSDSYTGGSGGNFNVVQGQVQPPPQTTAETLTPGLAIQQIISRPKISEIKVSEISTNSATISWKTDKPTDSYLEYGLEKDSYFLNVSSSNFVTDHNLVVKGPLLVPGAKFHFRILAKDSQGSSAASEDGEFKLLGYQLKIKVVDNFGRPLKGADVVLYSEPQQAKTDQNGEVIFLDVTPGKHLVVLRVDGLEKTAEVDVKDSPLEQDLQVKFDSSFLFLKTLLVVILILLALGVCIFIIRKVKSKGKSTTYQDFKS